ncbi:hypothetical protein OEZ85_013715 [Tetradesmus obliquus]|uniref:FAS1 domain-containing protein n=1 Tax=Tetradesmus obliquus TaxID=3088 RepID=A0ABY8UR84_TETOB|nr:hypothetical protein OEZ85_013715 [Tetradesmus obliquus]
MRSKPSIWASGVAFCSFGAALLLLLAPLQLAAAARNTLAVNASSAAAVNASSAAAVNASSAAVNASAAGQPQFDSVFTAAVSLNDTRRIREAFTAIGSKGLSPELVAEYQSSLGIIQSGDAQITALFPNELAWQREAAFVCMTIPEMMAYLQAHPKFGADSWLAFVFNGTLVSKDFKDGMVLRSLKPGLSVTLRRRNNTDGSAAGWYIPAASPNGTDVDVLPSDVSAGRGVVQLTTNFIVDGPLRKQHEGIRAGRGDNCSRYANTSGVDSGLDVPGFEAEVQARSGGGGSAAAAAPAAASSAGVVGFVGVWGGVGRLAAAALAVAAAAGGLGVTL